MALPSPPLQVSYSRGPPPCGWPSFNSMRSRSAEPVVAAVLPVAATVLVEDGHRDDVLGVLEAELGRHADLDRESVFAWQDLAVELECHLRLRMQRGRHVDRVRVALGADEVDVLGGEVGADALEEAAQRRAAP